MDESSNVIEASVIFLCLLAVAAWVYIRLRRAFVGDPSTGTEPTITKEKMQGWAIVAAIVVCGGVFYFFDLGLGRDQIADYAIVCAHPNSNNPGCTGGWKKGDRTVYTVSRDQQFVVEQREGAAPVRLQKCAVVDVKNWKCNEPPPPSVAGLDGLDKFWSSPIGFTNGRFTDRSDGYADPNDPFVRHISKSDWIFATEPPK
jgi:hypothetical protein